MYGQKQITVLGAHEPTHNVNVGSPPTVGTILIATVITATAVAATAVATSSALVAANAIIDNCY
jgi:hypothetical protein